MKDIKKKQGKKKNVVSTSQKEKQKLKAAPKPRKQKIQKSVVFLKHSLRETVNVEKTSIERNYFKLLREKRNNDSLARKSIVQQSETDSILQCPRCKNFTISFDPFVGRASDEPLLKKCRCRHCKYDYKI